MTIPEWRAATDEEWSTLRDSARMYTVELYPPDGPFRRCRRVEWVVGPDSGEWYGRLPPGAMRHELPSIKLGAGLPPSAYGTLLDHLDDLEERCTTFARQEAVRLGIREPFVVIVTVGTPL